MSPSTNTQTVTGKLPCKKSELDLGITLKGGQSFRWKEIPENKFIGVFSSTIWTLSQDTKHINYTIHNTSTIKSQTEAKKKLKTYLNLDLSLEKNLEDWSTRDEKFKNFTEKVAGVRILNQDVVENVFSFICSANNNITRITKMIEKLCSNFGEKIGKIGDEIYYDFPKIEKLAEPGVADILKNEGFGYRAKYINQTAIKLMELGGSTWLDELKKEKGETYENARMKLRILSGVGHKVADCICLMSLGHLESIPVDTHVFQVAKEFYIKNLEGRCKNKSPSLQICQEINEFFRNLWGENAGWAQTVVFCARISKNNEPKKSIKNKNNEEENNEEISDKKRAKKC